MHFEFRLRTFHVLACLALTASLPAHSAENPYPPGPDSGKQDGVPHGELIKGVFDQSKIFPGTTRDYTVYIPQQLERSKPAPLMAAVTAHQTSSTT